MAACCNVSVLAPTKIPAMSETLITACVSPATPASPMPTDYSGVLVPNPSCDIIVAYSLSEVQNGTTVVRVLNPSRDDIELLDNTLVSFILLHLSARWRCTQLQRLKAPTTCAPFCIFYILCILFVSL